MFLATLTAGWLVTTANMIADRASAPNLTIGRNLPARFEPFFRNHLAGRDALLAAHARLKIDGFGASSTPRVRIGDQGWLYYHAEAESNFLKPGDPALDRRLDDWITALSAWRAWLARRGAHLIVVVAPDKQSVYPEHLPPARQPQPGRRPLDRVLAGWSADPDLTVLDLRGPLKEAKQTQPVYYHSDTHWNPAGAFVAYTRTAEVLARWYPGLAPHPASAFDWPTFYHTNPDLVRLLSMSGSVSESFTQPQPRFARRALLRDEAVPLDESARLLHLRSHVWEGGNAGGPRVVLFHDSFAAGVLMENLAEHCARLVAVPSRQPDAGLIGRERPDVVILEFAERILQAETPRGPRD